MNVALRYCLLTLCALGVLCTVVLRAQTPGVSLRVGAERPQVYVPMLQDMRVGLLSNHTGRTAHGTHTLDTMLQCGVDVRVLFSPEHGFRGRADAGHKVGDSVDEATGLPVVSLYGRPNVVRRCLEATLDTLDAVVVDLQDVGVRFYTYHITMLEVMECAASKGKRVVVLDRPNPLGMLVDGPVLEPELCSGVGRILTPVIHGLTMAEIARMAVGEGWIRCDSMIDLHTVPCSGYNHSVRYRVPVMPSPNLKSMHAIYLYPSTCLFEGTHVSLGRGTQHPFEQYGHPLMESAGGHAFHVSSMPGATSPPLIGRLCHGVSLEDMPDDSIIAHGFTLEYIIDAYGRMPRSERGAFFTPFFDKLVGMRAIRPMIESGGATAAQLRALWRVDVDAFCMRRKPYLLYPMQ